MIFFGGWKLTYLLVLPTKAFFFKPIFKELKKESKNPNEVFSGFKDFQRKSNNFPKSRKRN
ncbi:hypothetical protein HID58_090173 [Brassica napus]|uniref:Uncharacterized protein n=1 Tax=Brassica napus TaxID=3708 RepID=A0ABQ7XDY7_BRANA|nr:hypothetical protein HID58_090173 [Brassica napus]